MITKFHNEALYRRRFFASPRRSQSCHSSLENPLRVLSKLQSICLQSYHYALATETVAALVVCAAVPRRWRLQIVSRCSRIDIVATIIVIVVVIESIVVGSPWRQAAEPLEGRRHRFSGSELARQGIEDKSCTMSGARERLGVSIPVVSTADCTGGKSSAAAASA